MTICNVVFFRSTITNDYLKTKPQNADGSTRTIDNVPVNLFFLFFIPIATQFNSFLLVDKINDTGRAEFAIQLGISTLQTFITEKKFMFGAEVGRIPIRVILTFSHCQPQYALPTFPSIREFRRCYRRVHYTAITNICQKLTPTAPKTSLFIV